MKKQLLSIILLGLLLLSLPGCAKEPTDTASPGAATPQKEQSEINHSDGNKEEEQTPSAKPIEKEEASNPSVDQKEEPNNSAETNSADKKEEPSPAEEIYIPAPKKKDKNYMDFQEKTKPMTREEAEDYLADKKADIKKPKYRQAVFTVNTTSAQTIIQEAAETKKLTPEVEKLFEGIAFRFIDEEAFASSTVKSYLIKLGTYEKGADGVYYFTFHDRTLAQATTNQEGNAHSISAYAQVLTLLLNDPNVEVLVQQ